MSHSYEYYRGLNIGLGMGILVVVSIVVIVLGCLTDLQMFFLKSIVGVELDSFQRMTDVPDESAGTVPEEKTRIFSLAFSKRNGELVITYGALVLLCGVLLGLMAVLIFDGCILGNAPLESGDDCPSYPMDCFLFPTRDNATIVQSFRCLPNDAINFTSIYPDGHAWCYGWIIGRQTTKNVLDQIGICAGLLGLFATIIVLFTYIMKYPNSYVVFSCLSLTAIVAAVLALAITGISVVLLTYVTLGLGALSVAWSCCLFGVSGFCVKSSCFSWCGTQVAPAPPQATPNSPVVQDV